MATGELQGKYQKLAQEYSKLRAQNQVLKKAVVDEQANSSALKEQMKMKEQSLRKQQQEMDSLTFRNQQLAKRVELLQEELSVMEAKGKKTKKHVESAQMSQEQKNVFDEDLQKKIEENERLHIQVGNDDGSFTTFPGSTSDVTRQCHVLLTGGGEGSDLLHWVHTT